MTLVLRLIALNIPLSGWRKFEEGQRNGSDSFKQSAWCNKKDAAVVQVMVSSCSHRDAVELIAHEWEGLPSHIRAQFTMKANEAMGTASGNVTKGLLALDEKLHGKLTRRVDGRQTVRELRVVGGDLVSRHRALSPAVVGAQRAFAASSLPFGYHNWKPSDKKRYQKKMAAERRASR